jgi:phage I-like protein
MNDLICRLLGIDLTDTVEELKAVKLSSTGGSPTRARSWIQVAKLGAFKGHPSGDFEFTPEVFDTMIRNFARTMNREVPIDFEHATEQPAYAGNIPRDGAPATGWLTSLENRRDGGLWGLVEWMEPGLSYIREGRYRYFSPAVVFDYVDNVTGESIGPVLVSGGLTNRPFLDGMAPVTASKKNVNKESTTMKLEELLKALALAMGEKDTVSPERAIELVAEMSGKNKELETEVVTMRTENTKRDKADAEKEVDALILSGVFDVAERANVLDQRLNNTKAFNVLVKALSKKSNGKGAATGENKGQGAVVTATEEKALTTQQSPQGGTPPPAAENGNAVTMRWSDKVHARATKLMSDKPELYRAKKNPVPNPAAYEEAERQLMAEQGSK